MEPRLQLKRYCPHTQRVAGNETVPISMWRGRGICFDDFCLVGQCSLMS